MSDPTKWTNRGNIRKHYVPPIENSLWNAAVDNENDAVMAAISNLHRSESQGIVLHGRYDEEPIAELLAVFSWRDTIISVPRAIIPDTNDKYKLFQLDDFGHARKPTTISKSSTLGFLDACHLNDKCCRFSRSRWALVRVVPRRRSDGRRIVAFQISYLPVATATGKNVDRSSLEVNVQQYALPSFEVNTENWYYAELLRRLGQFVGLAHAVPANVMRRYYQYLRMAPQDFLDLYANVPEEPPHGLFIHIPAPIETRRHTVKEDAKLPPRQPRPRRERSRHKVHKLKKSWDTIRTTAQAGALKELLQPITENSSDFLTPDPAPVQKPPKTSPLDFMRGGPS
jgi:hypothetical protein